MIEALAGVSWALLWLTLKVAVWATGLALVLGVALAALQVRRHYPGREWVDALLTLPMVLPPTVLGYFVLVWLGRQSAVGAWLEEALGLRLIFTWQGAVVAAMLVVLPLIYKSARAAFEGVDAQLLACARTLGVGEWALFWRVSLPLARNGIAAGTALAFARAMGEFGATLVVAGNIPNRTQTVSMAVYDALQSGNDALATVWVVIMCGVSMALLVLAGWWLRASPSGPLTRLPSKTEAGRRGGAAAG
jgi:molybdate transport system permease protein